MVGLKRRDVEGTVLWGDVSVDGVFDKVARRHSGRFGCSVQSCGSWVQGFVQHGGKRTFAKVIHAQGTPEVLFVLCHGVDLMCCHGEEFGGGQWWQEEVEQEVEQKEEGERLGSHCHGVYGAVGVLF